VGTLSARNPQISCSKSARKDDSASRARKVVVTHLFWSSVVRLEAPERVDEPSNLLAHLPDSEQFSLVLGRRKERRHPVAGGKVTADVALWPERGGSKAETYFV